MRNNVAKKSALVLSGGGAYGAYEIGVIKALFEGQSPSTSGPLDPHVFVGTSVGSFNAAVLAMNKGGARQSLDWLHNLWKDSVADNGNGLGNGVYRIRGNPGDYLDPRIPGSPIEQFTRFVADTTALGVAAVPRLLNLISPEGQLLDRIRGLVDISVFLDVEPFQRLIRETIEPATLRHSPKILKVTATEWRTGDAREFHFHKMTDEHTWQAICASAAIPGLFPPVELLREIFLDGGVVQNTPIGPAVDAGAEEIHVVSLNPKMTHLPESHISNTLDTFSRVYTAMLTANINEDIESAKWINHGIEALERVEAGEEVDSLAMHRFARAAGVIVRKLRQNGQLPSKLTIHRYFPVKPLGGMLGMLNFHRAAIDAMIDQGYADTRAHNCRTSGCVIPAVVEHAAQLNAVATATAS